MDRLIVDSREPAAIRKALVEKGARVAQLPAADFCVMNADNTKELLYIERKTLGDLYASLNDNRFVDQRSRLKESGVKAIYILEDGCIPSEGYRGRGESQMMGPIVNLPLFYDTSVLPSRDMNQTVRIVESIVKKTSGDYKPKSSATIGTPLKKGEKASNMIFEAMLVQIQGVSLAIAKKVTAVYPTPKDLVMALSAIDHKQQTQALADIRLTEKRKLGPAVAEKIYNAFFVSAKS